MAAFAIAGPSLPWFPTAPLASPLASPPASSAPRPATSSTGGAAAVSAGAAAVSAVSAARRSRVTRRAEAKVATEEEEDVYYRSATPRERQFGMYESPRRRRSSSQGAVEVPLSQLHVVAAQRQLPMLLEALPETDASEAIFAWSELLVACQAQAPELLKTWSCGIGPLLRLAVAVPKEQWLRSPKEPWCEPSNYADEAEGPEGPTLGFEALPKLEKLIRHLLVKYEDAPMALAGGFTWSDGAGGTLREREGREVVLCSASGMSLCLRFIQLFREVCQGTRKPVAAAQDLLSSTLTKKMVGQLMASAAEELPKPPPVEVPDSTRHVQPVEVTLQSPLMALRRAQLEIHAAGGKVLGDALGRTRLAKDLGTVEEEEFTLELLAWLSRFAEEPEFQESSSAAQCVEWLLSQRALDPKFSLVLGGNPRAPKKVLAAAKRDAATLELERLQQSGQRFLPNPAKIKGFVKRGVMAPFGSPYETGGEATWVPERLRFLIGEASLLREPSPPNSWQGDEYEPCEAEERFLQDPKYLRKATVRIDEILSFEYLQHVGQTMRNCLRVERRGGMSLMKYLSRVKARESSFWVMTITAEEEEEGEEVAPVQHLLLMEVYNGLNVIHQAEGSHPRRWPRLDAWRWLQEWAQQEDLRPDGPEGVTVGPYGGYDGRMERWDIRRCFLW
ncbi:unnamed protein product [Durusdinium trenchii]|uniref:Uncharacterized protein n=1 Tax=Durusdinium trenchii TaxID=1381693 RepID=A0ABP0P0J9_9DINO